MSRNQNLRVVVTGVTRGLGRAMTERLAEAGHTVLGCGRSPAAVRELRERFGPPHDFAAVDVADAGQVDAWAERLLAGWGAPDYLINNASIINRNAPLWEVTAEEFSTVVDVNVKGTANTVRAFTPAMIERGSGIIVNFSSGWGRSTSPEVAPYCATKWAVEGLTQALAQELPSGMAAVAVNPGVIDTAMLRSCWSDAAGSYPSPEPWSRQAVPFLLNLRPRDNGKSLTVAG